MGKSINNLTEFNNLLKGLLKNLESEADVICTKSIIEIFKKDDIIGKKASTSDFIKNLPNINYSRDIYEKYKTFIPKDIIINFLIKKSYIYYNICLESFLRNFGVSLNFKKDTAVRSCLWKLFEIQNIQILEGKIFLDDFINKISPLIEEFLNIYNEGYEDLIYTDIDFYRFLFTKILIFNGESKYSFPHRDLLSASQVLNIINKNSNISISRDKVMSLINLSGISVYNIPKIERSMDFNSNPKSWVELCETYICIRKSNIENIENLLRSYSNEELRKMAFHKTVDKIAESKYNGDKGQYYKEIKSKRKTTILERYGGYEEIQNRVREGLLNKYGTSNINNLEWKKEKTKKTMLNRYGVSHISQTNYFKEKIKDTYTKNRQKNLEYLQNKYNKSLYDFKDLAEKFGYTNPENLKIAAERIGIPLYKGFKYSFIDEDGIKDLENYINSPMSSGEFFISKFLEENNIKFIHNKRFENCRDKLSLPFDFYLPDYNVCIEYQGEQHFKEIPFLTYCTHDKKVLNKNEVGLEERQRKDNIKKEFCKNNNIKLLEPAYYHSNEEIKMIIIEALNLY